MQDNSGRFRLRAMRLRAVGDRHQAAGSQGDRPGGVGGWTGGAMGEAMASIGLPLIRRSKGGAQDPGHQGR